MMASRLLLLVAGALACLSVSCTTEPTYVASSGPGGTGTGSSGSGGPACAVANDCPGKENECSTRTCVDGVCGLDLEPEGFLVAAQAGGDCKKAICDGKGEVTSAADDSDVPSDGNSCTQDLCSGGQASHPSAPPGTACGIGLTCNDAGQCFGCTDPSQCGVDSACTAFACESKVCVFDYVAAGQGDPGGQQAGDCYRLTCNGMGGTSTVPDDTDVPVDGNGCTLDECTMGAASNPPAPAGTTCGGSFECDGSGSCLGCLQASDCGQNSACATYTCPAGKCATSFVPAGQGDPGGQVAGDCQKKACNGAGGVASIPDDADVPTDGNVCTNDVCSGGVPSNPYLPADTPCGGAALHCNGSGVCTGCVSNADCGSPTACATPVCAGGSCTTEFVPYGLGDPGGQSGGDCKKKVCNGSGSAVTIGDDGDPYDDGNPCTYDVCSGGNPSNPAAPSHSGCPGGICDGGGSCVQCISNGDCGSPTACATPVCNGGGCGNDFVPYGQGNPGGQSGGDCKWKTCDGNGGVAQVNDDGDVPNDGNACTDDVCSNGNPSNPPVPIQNDGNPCTNDVCNPGTGNTDHPAVGDGTPCGACQSCYGGACSDNCTGCEYCYQNVCYWACGGCEYCNGSYCEYDPSC